ncbi:MAG TPA: ABC transporter permease [Actinomycetota bacterium]|nr:ABC transporter permease [Actinomycetota bacterium]
MIPLMTSELKMRLRGRRWWLLLLLWVAVLFLLLLLVWKVTQPISFGPTRDPIGPIMFGSLMMLVLGFAALIVPSLTATSINGEREKGTLAVLQATLLRPHQIVLAKFGAAWITSLAFVVATLPLTLWCILEGGVGLLRVAAVYLVLVVTTAFLVSIGLGVSSFIKRSALSAAATYGVVGTLIFGTLFFFGISMAGAPQREVRQQLPDGTEYVTFEPVIGQRWLWLAPNPFVVLADAAPGTSPQGDGDPLTWISEAARSTRAPSGRFLTDPGRSGPPLWPAGIAIYAALALISVLVARGRLRVPARKLVPGERIA